MSQWNTEITDSFVYRWTDHLTNKLYIGSHKGSIEDGYICSSKVMLSEYLSRPTDFSREILAEGDYPSMRLLESQLLRQVNAAKNELYYNKNNGDGSFYCSEHRETSKSKISETLRSLNLKPFLGRKHSTETRQKYSLDRKGRPSHRKGKVLSMETRRKMSLAKMGNIPGNKGLKITEETREKIRISSTGRKHSTETKIKISNARKNYEYQKSLES